MVEEFLLSLDPVLSTMVFSSDASLENGLVNFVILDRQRGKVSWGYRVRKGVGGGQGEGLTRRRRTGEEKSSRRWGQVG